MALAVDLGHRNGPIDGELLRNVGYWKMTGRANVVAALFDPDSLAASTVPNK